MSNSLFLLLYLALGDFKLKTSLEVVFAWCTLCFIPLALPAIARSHHISNICPWAHTGAWCHWSSQTTASPLSKAQERKEISLGLMKCCYLGLPHNVSLWIELCPAPPRSNVPFRFERQCRFFFGNPVHDLWGSFYHQTLTPGKLLLRTADPALSPKIMHTWVGTLF